MTRPLLTVLMGATLLSGCNLAPAFIAPQGVVPAVLPDAGVVLPDASGATDLTRIGWEAFFVDARLRGVIDQGLANNRDLRVAAASVLAARARYGITRADRLPTINASGAATFTDNPAQAAAAGEAPGSDVELYTADLGFSAFELDFFGRVRNLDEAALQQYLATEEAQRAARVSLIAEIAGAWLRLASDQDQLRLSRQILESYGETRDLTRELFRIGTASELEARQADVLYQGARNDIAVLETRIAQDRNALDLLVGAPVPAALLPDGLVQGVGLDRPPTDLSSDVLLRRPDVRQAERQLLSQNANIGAARAALFPSISLTGSGGSSSTSLGDLFADGSFAYSLTPSVRLPIFDSGRNQANVRAAEAQAQAATATYEQAIQTAFREVADALAQRRTIDEQLDSQTQRAGSAQAAAEISEARYRVGVSSYLVALDSQRTAYTIQQQLIGTRLARETNLVEIYRALGGGAE